MEPATRSLFRAEPGRASEMKGTIVPAAHGAFPTKGVATSTTTMNTMITNICLSEMGRRWSASFLWAWRRRRCGSACGSLYRCLALSASQGYLIGGWPIYKEALENLIAKRMTMELSMSIAIIAAAAISEFFTALVITLFVLVAEVLEGLTVSRGRRAIRDLLDFLPRAVSVRRAGGISEVDADMLAVGDAVLVNPGGRIPIDGTVIAGHSFVDQARITGESMPLEKTVECLRLCGPPINQSGALEIRAERIGRDTSYGKIIEADRASRAFTGAIRN